MTGARRSGIREINFPVQLQAGLAAIADLDENEAAVLRRTFERAKPFQRVSELEQLTQDALPIRHRDTAEGVVSLLLSLSTLARTTGAPSVVTAASRSADLELDEEQRKQLSAYLDLLIKTGAVYSAASAIDLLTQHERNYSSARVITDLRPVFSSNVEEQPTGAVVVETLHLQTWDRDGNSETLHVAMDDVDLRELHRVIDRAISKTETLRKMLDDQGITYFELDERTK